MSTWNIFLAEVAYSDALVDLENERANDDGEPRYRKVKCSRCGEPTTYDPTYGDLCYRHIRADNE